ncbi:RNA-binding protein 12B-like [Tiliqua scincoides]|uniref:RNA-binding protein 12B-like n=1 Tax=Tiliqua scincoides TaxID=71010 RepID=UPI0034632D71
MAVVIRLQGLPVVAGSADIRRFFSGLNIPDGGVHIIGGESGEAFIIFATDEDARQAMSCSGGFIKDSSVKLFLSSKTEMQHIIEISRKRFDRDGRETIPGSRRTGSNSGGSGVGNLSNLVAAIKKGISKSNYGSLDALEDKFHSSGSQNSDTDLAESNYEKSRQESDNLYLFVRGMPYAATEDDVHTFFSGLQVDSVIMLKSEDGQQNGDGMVKFATSSDAMKGRQRNREYMGSRFIEVYPSNEVQWIKYGGRVDEKVDCHFDNEHVSHLNKERYSSSRDHSSRRDSSYLSSRKYSHSRSPPRRVMARSRSRSPPRRAMARSRSSSLRRAMARSCSRSPPRRAMARSRSRSPPRRGMVCSRSRSPPRRAMARSRSRSLRRAMARSRSRSPLRRGMARSRSRSPPRRSMAHSRSPRSGSSQSHLQHNEEYYIHIKNLPAAVEKRDLRVFFGELDITSQQVIFLRSHENEKKEAFVMFRSKTEYRMAQNYHKNVLFGQSVYIFPISKKMMLEVLESTEAKRSPERHHHVREKCNRDGYSGPKTCVYIRNFPFDVTNVEVQKFFAGFNIDDSDIHLLYDDKGIGLGEALVKFRSEDQAQKAESLNRRRFLGTEVLLRCIPEEQMQEFGINVSSNKMQDHFHVYDRGEQFCPVGSQGPAMQGNIRPLSYNQPSENFICSPDGYRGPPPFAEFGGPGISGGFPDGCFLPNSNFTGGSDSITLIRLKNIPFRASPNEILDFFHGYKVIPESISIQHNDYGMPSGEAVLALVNYSEAMAAINELNDRPFGQRKAKLSLM